MMSLLKSRATLRGVSLVLVVLFLNLVTSLQTGALLQGHVVLQGAKAASGDVRKVAVFVLPATDADVPSAAVLNSIVREKTGQIGDVELVPTTEARGGDVLASAEKLTDTGMAALSAGDHAAAGQTLEQAYALLLKALGAVPRRLQARIHKGMGLARFFAGDKAAARDHIRRSLLLFEKQSAAEYDYSLDAKNLYREVRQSLQDQATSTLEVRSDPPGAEVYVDHYLKGYTVSGTDLVLQNLLAGPHFVRLELDGHVVWADYVETEPAGTETVSVDLEPAADLARFRLLRDNVKAALLADRGEDPNLPALRDHLKADAILALVTESTAEGFHLKGFFIATDGAVIPVEESVVQDATLYQSLQDFTAMTIGGEYEPQEMLALDSPSGASGEVALVPMGGAEDLVINPDSPIFSGVRKEQPTPVYKKWWFWTIVGVAVAGVGTGIGFLSTGAPGGGGSGPTGGVSVQLNQF